MHHYAEVANSLGKDLWEVELLASDISDDDQAFAARGGGEEGPLTESQFIYSLLRASEERRRAKIDKVLTAMPSLTDSELNELLMIVNRGNNG